MFKGLKKRVQGSSRAEKSGSVNGGKANGVREPAAHGPITNGHTVRKEDEHKNHNNHNRVRPQGNSGANNHDGQPTATATDGESEQSKDQSPGPSLPDYMTNCNAVLDDPVSWRHGKVPDYTAANTNYLRERTNVWPPGSLEDLVSNLVKNWEKEASFKMKLGDWRTINQQSYKFSCNGGRDYTADEMMEIGTYNALIQEAAFYSAKHTSFEESHDVFRRAMPGGFSWEVTEVYSGPPVVAFKWRHWGKMTGKLVCPLGPDTRLEADPTNQEVEIWGICIAHLDPDFKIGKIEIFYDPHELMASLVDARNLSYKSPEAEQKLRTSLDMRALTNMIDTMQSEHQEEFSRGAPIKEEEFSELDGARSLMSDSLASELPSDAALLSALTDKPAKRLAGSRCPFPY